MLSRQSKKKETNGHSKEQLVQAIKEYRAGSGTHKEGPHTAGMVSTANTMATRSMLQLFGDGASEGHVPKVEQTVSF